MSRRKKIIKNIGWKRDKHSLGARAQLKSLKRYCTEVWAEFIKERDGHKCIICGHIGKYLNSHHIITTKCTHTRYDINVGITLCAKCHKLGTISAHTTPWILYDWLQINRPEQYEWFLAHKKDVYLPPMQFQKEDYKLILHQLLQLFEQQYPQVLLRSKYYKFTEEEEQHIIRDYIEDNTASLRSTAKKYKVGEQALRGVFKRNAVPIRHNPGKHRFSQLRNEVDEKICREYLKDKYSTQRSLSKKYGLSPHTIHRILIFGKVKLKSPNLWRLSAVKHR